jgi:hypothetical protein
MKDRELFPDSFYEERRVTPKWRQGVLPSAGIWLAEGSYHVAVYGSAAASALAERGALLVASLVFDGSHAERPVRGDAAFDVYPAAELAKPRGRRAMEMLGWAPIGN